VNTTPANPRFAERAAAIFANRPKRTNQTLQPTQSEAVSARYLTRAGEALRLPDLATEVITSSSTSHKVRCHCGFTYPHAFLRPAKDTASQHAETCRAMPTTPTA
jgi:hypothetical protein